MAEDDRYRIESRLRGMQRGIAPQPEDIETLRQRQEEADRHNQPEPERPFSSYLEVRPDEEQDEQAGQDGSDAEKRDGNEKDADSARGAESNAKITPEATAVPPDRAQVDRQAHLLQQRLAERLASRQDRGDQVRPNFFDVKKKPPPDGSGRR